MASITIKGIPEHIHHNLKRQAARNHRSLNQEAVRLIEAGMQRSSSDEDLLRRIDELRAGLETANHALFDEWKREGRS